jgi:hypothetical protein
MKKEECRMKKSAFYFPFFLLHSSFCLQLISRIRMHDARWFSSKFSSTGTMRAQSGMA